MNKNIIKKAKEYALRLLKYTGRRPLYIICKDSCSEISRLLALWFQKEIPKVKIFIAKGKIKNHAHELIIIDNDKEIYIIDPTVWQFFKCKRSIFIGEVKTIEGALNKLSNIYGGKWKISEQVKKYSKNKILELKKVLKRNLHEFTF